MGGKIAILPYLNMLFDGFRLAAAVLDHHFGLAQPPLHVVDVLQVLRADGPGPFQAPAVRVHQAGQFFGDQLQRVELKQYARSTLTPSRSATHYRQNVEKIAYQKHKTD